MFFRAITYILPVIVVSITLHLSALHARPWSPQGSDLSRTSATHLVLKNGQVVMGKISRNADSVFVQTDGGSRVVFPVERIEFVCNSLKEAYWQKNARVKASDLDAHVDLFHWCMKQGLLKEAQNQIDLLVTMEIKAVQLEYLNRQLLVALTQQRKFQRQLLANQVPQNSQPEVTNREPSGSEIALVGFESDQTVASEFERLNTLKRIEAAIDSIPKKSVGIFKRKVEPLLVRNCCPCHTDQRTEVMPLMRLGLNQVIPKRLSQRNLYHVLQYTDMHEPLASPLFAAAVSAHADLKEPILKKDSVQYTNLEQWLIQISTRPNAMHWVPDFEQRVDMPGLSQPVQPKVPEVALAPVQSTAKPDRAKDVPDIPQLHRPGVTEKTGLDPFDADVFNRKHLNEKKEQD